MTAENDLVLIYLEDKPLSFARIETIEPDIKKDWYHVTLLLLQIPLNTVTWILRDIYIDGVEFTMGGNRMRLEKVISPETPDLDDTDDDKGDLDSSAKGEQTPAKVIAFTQRKKS